MPEKQDSSTTPDHGIAPIDHVQAYFAIEKDTFVKKSGLQTITEEIRVSCKIQASYIFKQAIYLNKLYIQAGSIFKKAICFKQAINPKQAIQILANFLHGLSHSPCPPPHMHDSLQLHLWVPIGPRIIPPTTWTWIPCDVLSVIRHLTRRIADIVEVGTVATLVDCPFVEAHLVYGGGVMGFFFGIYWGAGCRK